MLASTASILNLCVISLDRYWAIEEPMSYPAKVSSIKDVASLLHNFEPLPPHITFFLLLKVRKFQKQIIIFSILPKTHQKSSIIVVWNKAELPQEGGFFCTQFPSLGIFITGN